ncbi:tRNA isopentenyltransferase [Coniophora puteana RWD-64-598 SS2]|uniref:tRNA isopentenyltransferase n=1 Tax=Coniophora puteana (strain RWD-64-598) TaxID=741705 RepID=A0A5M3N1S7_CONPW|nr:tRNA isopentenyltransferase [Coniophora puteana RWD-64-598 SS2]EIW85343.1 tRNA isopentenyltransferase [Coniophora puteana RWD-64-598 SS2]
MNPLIAICGTTGVGKSKLSIELALKLSEKLYGGRWTGARVINADSMQVYTGLDIITNKVPLAERQGVEHVLMDIKQPGEQYVVGEWVRDAIDIIDETHRRNQIPIVVGGTSYWIQHLIFPNRLVSPSASPSPSSVALPSSELADSVEALPQTLRQLYDNLPEVPPSAAVDPEAAYSLHSLLSALDDRIASRWHWRDTRKVLRSLHIAKDSSRKPSEIIDEQSQTMVVPRYRTLCFWLYADLPIINPRLDERVDEMIRLGLVDEIRSLQRLATMNAAHNDPGKPEKQIDMSNIDFTKGIFQSIGFKEFQTYLEASIPDGKLFEAAVETMKQSTRKYAKRQISWIRNKLLPVVNRVNSTCSSLKEALTPTYLLDANELGIKWDTEVRERAEAISIAFVEDEDLPDPLSLSDTAERMLAVEEKLTDPTAVLEARRKVVCPICSTDPLQPVMVEEGKEWAVHAKTRLHRRLLAKSTATPHRIARQAEDVTQAEDEFSLEGSTAFTT